MPGAISPVKAPFSSMYMFSAPTSTFVPFTASTTGTISIAGTQYTTSTSSDFTKSFNSSTNLTASLGVMFIFQFPATIFLLAIFSLLLTEFTLSYDSNTFVICTIHKERASLTKLLVICCNNTRKLFAL